MSTSLKAELETWAAALNAYDEQDFDKALEFFSRIADSSKILTNMGLIYATIGEHEIAVKQFMAATTLDPYLAIAYFQCGVSNFLLSQYELALQNFEDALLYLRGNQTINYEQIGLKFQLFTPEVLFNKGLSQIYLGYQKEGLAEMEEASKLKVIDEHNVIDDAIRDGGEGYTVFSIPVGVLYRPSESKLKNSKSKDYLGKAKLVAAADETDAFTEFTGVKKLKEEREKARERDQKSDNVGLKRSATVPPPRIDPIDPIGHLERSKTTVAPLERMNTFSRPSPPFTSRRTRSDVTDISGLPSSLSRNNTVSVSRSNTVIRPQTPASSATVSRGPTMSRNEAMPIQAVNQPGTLFQPSPPLQNPYFDPLQISNQYQQQYQSPLPTPVRNQDQRPQPYTNQSPRDGYQAPPVSLQPTSPAASRAPFVLPAARPSPREPPVARQPESYDDHINAYAEEPPRSLMASSLVNEGQDRVVLWPQDDAQSGPGTLGLSVNPSIQRMPSRGPAGSYSQAPSSIDALRGADMVRNAGGGSIRRKPTRRPTQRRPRPTYEEEEEGYVSGEYDEPYELMTIRVKLHYQEDIRGMTLTPDTSFEEFVERVTSKFGTAMDGLGLKFKDEDDVKVTLRDSSDYELAIETARHTAKGKLEGKLEIWCADLRT